MSSQTIPAVPLRHAWFQGRVWPQKVAAALRRASPPAVGAILPLAVLGAWYWTTARGMVKPLFLPSPMAVVAAFRQMVLTEGFSKDLLASLSVVVRGWFWGTLVGVTLGVAGGSSRGVERAVGPLLNGLRQVPALAWFPLIALWIGVGNMAKEVVIAKSVFFPVLLNTLQGIRNIPPNYVEMGRVFGFTRGQMLRRVVFPAAAPTIVVGIRYAAGLAWAMIVAAEMLSGRTGLGFLLEQSQDMLLTDHLFVVIVTIGVVGFTVDTGLRYVERRLFRWKEDEAR
jgi:sulfonate transport system permease protein